MASKAFEKEFAKQRAAGAKEFSFGKKKYNTKLAADAPKKKSKAPTKSPAKPWAPKDKVVSGGSTVGTSMGKLPDRMPKTTSVIPTPRTPPAASSLPNNKHYGPSESKVKTSGINGSMATKKAQNTVRDSKAGSIAPDKKVTYGPQSRQDLSERVKPNSGISKSNSGVSFFKHAMKDVANSSKVGSKGVERGGYKRK